MLLKILFLLSVFLPNIGIPLLLPTDNQPIAPLIALLLLLLTKNLVIPKLSKIISLVFFTFSFLSLLSIFCGFSPQILRHSITYLLVIPVFIVSSSISFNQQDFRIFFKFFSFAMVIGYFLNIFFPSLLSLFVLRSSLVGGIRALSSFYSEPAFLCQLIILLCLFLLYFSSINRLYLITVCALLMLPAAAGQIILSFLCYHPYLFFFSPTRFQKLDLYHLK